MHATGSTPAPAHVPALSSCQVLVALLPVVLALIAAVRGIAPSASQPTAFYEVPGGVWLPGMGLALSRR